MICECCNKGHDGSFGSGRFCSKSCANTRHHSEKTRNQIGDALRGPEKFCSCGTKIQNHTRMCKKCYNRSRLGTGQYGVTSNMVTYISNRHRQLRKISIDSLGGKCFKCGYSRCSDALDFHHRDPEEKSFGLSEKHFNRSIESLKKEVNKCILLCATCHREYHFKQRQGISLSAFLSNTGQT